MTNEEALYELKRRLPAKDDNLYAEAYDMAIEALEKQIPKKPSMEKRHSFCPAPYCPSCGYAVYSPMQDKFCKYCGQKIDWSEEK